MEIQILFIYLILRFKCLLFTNFILDLYFTRNTTEEGLFFKNRGFIITL